MRALILMITTSLLSACGSSSYRPVSSNTSSNTYSGSYSQGYSQGYAQGTKTVASAPARNSSLLSFDQLVRFEYNCSRRNEQIEFLQDQLRKKTFYRVDGVDGNEYADRISKRYFALARFRIWSLRLGCQGSHVEKATEIQLKTGGPSRPPESTPRCYFEESVVAHTKLGVGNKAAHGKDSNDSVEKDGASENVVTKRREFCTNYPLLADRRFIGVGDTVDPQRELEKNIPYIPNLRKWNGNIFQLVSKTEMHLNEVVKFTVVLMWSGRAWVVVDKF